jgi:CBS domain containing-hemolysin-like protein
MDPAPFPWIDVVIILALIGLNGLFAMSELAIVSSRPARLQAMADAGSSGAAVDSMGIQDLTRNKDRQKTQEDMVGSP